MIVRNAATIDRSILKSESASQGADDSSAQQRRQAATSPRMINTSCIRRHDGRDAEGGPLEPEPEVEDDCHACWPRGRGRRQQGALSPNRDDDALVAMTFTGGDRTTARRELAMVAR